MEGVNRILWFLLVFTNKTNSSGDEFTAEHGVIWKFAGARGVPF